MKVLPFKREPNPNVIAACKRLLADAEAGELLSIVAVGARTEGAATEYWGINGDHWLVLAGAAACLERRVQDKLREREDR